MKVVHIQKSILATGRAPLRLHNALIEARIESSVLSMEFDINFTESIKKTGKKSRIKARLNHFLQSFITDKVNKQYGMYSFPILGTDITNNEIVRSADIIYIHWVQGGFLNLKSYRKLAQLGKPIIVFMHDMWSITGGCHHSFTCDKYKSKCYDCQMFPKKTIIDWPTHEFIAKGKLYSDFKNIYFVSPSKWLYDCAKQSFLTKNKTVFHIPNIINSELFKQVDRKYARQFLNLNEKETIIAFGANLISSAYKGWSELVKALKILKTYESLGNITVLIFGEGYNSEIEKAVPFKTVFMGFLKDEYSTVLVYNAADVFVTPSLADNFPTTVLESQSCGTPVVGFEVGGIPDMIKHKENGYLARFKDSEDFAYGIMYCLVHNLKGRLNTEFEKNVLVQKHTNLMKSVLK